MIRISGRRRAARLVLTAGLATTAVVTGLAGTATAGTPAALPTGTILAENGPDAITGNYIVLLRPDAGQVTSVSRALVQRYGGVVEEDYTAAVRGFHVAATAAQARRLAADPRVESVEQDAVVSLEATQSSPVWGLDRIDQAALPLDLSYTYRSAAGVTAYVLDTGVRTTSTDFGGRARIGASFIDDKVNGGDCHGHGTHVAGTIGGTKYGVAKDVKLVSVRVLDCRGSGSFSAIIAGVDWVTRNAVRPAVANMSLGGITTSTSLNKAVQKSIASGVTYAVAAGNDNAAACQQSPASTAEAITVAASDQDDARASFSNYGSCVDLFAPGVRITSDSHTSDTGTTIMSGTSMASPHVAGAAALVLGANPAWNPAQVTSALLANASAGRITSVKGSPNKLLNTAWLNTPAVQRSAGTGCGPYTNGTDVAVRKNGTITSSRTVTGCAGTTRAATVAVTIKDAYRGSLAVSLVTPGGATVTLKAAAKSDHASGVSASYPVKLPATAHNGTWKLVVRDAYGSTGTLDSWTLRF